MSEKYEHIKEKAYTVGLIVRTIPDNWGVKGYGFRYYLTGRGYVMHLDSHYPTHIMEILSRVQNNNIDFFPNLEELEDRVNDEFEKRKSKYFISPPTTSGKNKTLFRRFLKK